MEPTDSAVTIRLEGKVVGPWVEECHRAWEAIRAESGSKKIRLDLRAVTFVDESGTAMLRNIHWISGAEVLADSPLTNYFAQRIMREIEKTEKRRSLT